MSDTDQQQRGEASRGDALAARGKYKRALVEYEREGDYVGVGEMHEKLGNAEEAAMAFRKGGKLKRSAQLLASLGRHEEASRMYIEAGELAQAAESLVVAGKPADAARVFERAGVHERAAELYEEGGRFDKAAELYEAAGDHERGVRVLVDNKRPDLAARFCMNTGDYVQAAKFFTELGRHTDAAQAFVKANMKPEALDALEQAGSLEEASRLCEELGMQERAAKIQEQLGNRFHAANLYSASGQFVSAGRIFEEDAYMFEAAQMYERDDQTVDRAAVLFRETYGSETAWQSEMPLPVWDLALASEAQRVAVALAGSEVKLLSNEGEEIWSYRVPMGVRARTVAITARSTHVAVGTEGRSIYLLDGTKNLQWKRELGGEIRGLAFGESGNLVFAGGTDGFVNALTMEGTDEWTFQADYKIWCLEVHDEKKMVMLGTGNGNLYLLNYDGELVWKLNVHDWVSRLAIHKDGGLALAVLGLNKVCLIDIADRSVRWTYEAPETVQDIVFWNTKRYVVTTNSGAFILNDKQQRCWRYAANDRAMRVERADDGQTMLLGHFERGVIVMGLLDCRLRSAENFERCGEYSQAAELFAEENELKRAAALYAKATEYEKAGNIAKRVGELELAGDYYEKGGLFPDAAACFEEVNLIDRAAKCYEAAGENSKAGSLLASLGDQVKAAELHMQTQNYEAAGVLFESAGAFDQAREAFEKAQESADLSPESALALGRILLSDERLDDVIKLLQPHARDEEHGAAVETLLGDTFMEKGLFSLAIDHYKEALGEDPQANAQNLDIVYGLGLAYEKAGMYSEAKEVLQDLLVVDYYYKDVAGRLDRIKELSGIFSPVSSTATNVTTAVNATVAGGTPSRYEIIRKLGEGGMGVVYQARDTKLSRDVALKVLPSKMSQNDELRSRFAREARAVAALNHRNIVGVYDIGEEWGESYIAMEFIEGPPLRDVIHKEKKLSPVRTFKYAKQIAGGLADAHQRGVIHRDIKPENIMLAEADDEVKVMDFGLARMEEASNLTQEGSVMGTLRYMSPEQIKGQRVDASTDIYALGVMLYEMMAGEPPFPEGNMGYHHVNTIPKEMTELGLGIPKEFSDIVKKCLEKDAAARFPDGQSLEKALGEFEVTD